MIQANDSDHLHDDNDDDNGDDEDTIFSQKVNIMSNIDVIMILLHTKHATCPHWSPYFTPKCVCKVRFEFDLNFDFEFEFEFEFEFTSKSRIFYRNALSMLYCIYTVLSEQKMCIALSEQNKMWKLDGILWCEKCSCQHHQSYDERRLGWPIYQRC